MTTTASKYLTLLLATAALLLASVVHAQPWVLEVLGCSSQNAFFLAESRNGACLPEGDGITWRKITCTQHDYSVFQCSDSGCSNCNLLNSRKLHGCQTPSNDGVYCSATEPNYAIYAGPHYLVNNIYAHQSECSGEVLSKNIWKATPYCSAFPEVSGGFSYIVTCGAKTVDWEMFKDPSCSVLGSNLTEPLNRCYGQRAFNTCV